MKVLIVEDDPFLQRALVTKFEKDGFEAIAAKDGAEAIEKVNEKPNIVLLDLMLPKKSGFEVLAEYKTRPDFADFKVIIISNLGQKDDIQKGMDLGAVDYIIKAEAKIDDIVTKVKGIVEGK